MDTSTSTSNSNNETHTRTLTHEFHEPGKRFMRKTLRKGLEDDESKRKKKQKYKFAFIDREEWFWPVQHVQVGRSVSKDFRFESNYLLFGCLLKVCWWFFICFGRSVSIFLFFVHSFGLAPDAGFYFQFSRIEAKKLKGII